MSAAEAREQYLEENQKIYTKIRILLNWVARRIEKMQRISSTKDPLNTIKEQPPTLYYFIKEMQKKQDEQLAAFLCKYKSSLSKEVCSAGEGQIKASIAQVEDVEEAALKIQNGELVAVPTETVYGLGTNALNPEALKRIYATKRRPLTDPIIVHVLDSTEAKKLVEMDQKQAILFELLTKRYWPGPLTIILKANLDILPAIVTAQTGYVGIRAPKHPYARKLIQASKLPIGAPSANLFSHVSPTEPVHVFNDFFNCSISIVDGQRCEYGVESTVIKLVQNQINVLRQGSLSISRLQAFLKEMIPEQELPAVIIHRKVIGKNINMEAPGQLLKHYAPYLPCYFFCEDQAQPGVEFQNKTNEHRFKLSETAFISFSEKHYSNFAEKCKFYFQVEKTGEQEEKSPSEEEEDLFCSKEDKVKMREIYSLLRQCQNLQVSGIVIGWGSAKEGTLWDKIFRSTQGEHVVSIF